jgi:hypothetical protein
MAWFVAHKLFGFKVSKDLSESNYTLLTVCFANDPI